jgi:hypothetical protein
MRLIPREEKFFHFFNEQADLLVQAARLLNRSAREGPESLARNAEGIALLEARADEITHEIFTKLNQTFITPLDPEDIHSLGSHLDDVMDGIEEAAHRLVAYHVDPIPPAVLELCASIEACCASLQRAFSALSSDQPLLEHCIEINRLEDQADHMVRTQISLLFETERDPIALIKYKEVYEALELTTDYCEDVADALQNVVVKNS